MPSNIHGDFITAILGEMVGNAVMGLRDQPGPRGKVNRYTDFKYPEQLEDMIAFADAHRNEDLYISPLIYGEDRVPESAPGEKPNPNAGKVRRTPENALFSQTIYQDSDHCPIEKFRIPPSIHITSSAGKYQDFWQLIEPIPAQEAAEISHKIAVAHRADGSDPSSWSANKVLRVPDSVNTTHGFPEHVEAHFTGAIYSDIDIAGAYDDIELDKRPIMRLPADVSYDTDMDLPDYATALDKLPSTFDLEILTKEHGEGTDRSRMRYRMLCDLFRAEGLSFEEVLSLAWHAPVSKKWKEDPRNLRGLIAEALKAQTEVAYETGEGAEAPDRSTTVQLKNENPKTGWPRLLTEAERTQIQGETTWLDRWDEWCRVKLGRAYNGPYVRMNGVTCLSAAFSSLGYIPRGNGAEGLNIYTMGIGDSGSGKSSALKLWDIMMNEIFDIDKGWDIGSNASPNALHEKLLERDEKVSVFNADEAHGWFKQVNTQQWADGVYEDLAKYFDGRVPPILRTGNREISGKTAKTHFIMHLMGTMKGELSITNVLTKSMFLSGFLARFVWYIGEPSVLTEDSMEEDQSNAEYVSMGFEPMARQWAAEFNNTKKQYKIRHKKPRIAMLMDKDSLARMKAVKWQAIQMYKDHTQWDILEPALKRFGPNIRRLATLLALEEGSDIVTLKHTLLAIQHAEEWLGAMVTMAEKISDSEWARQCNDIEAFIMQKGSRVRYEVVMRKFNSRRSRDLLEQVSSLKDQGRIIEKTTDGAKWLSINE